MSDNGIVYTVFTKPWKMPTPELGKHIKALGFDGIELPVRPGYQVEPENVTKGLPECARQLADFGIKIYSVAGPSDEATIAACAEAGAPIIRVMARVGDEGYMATEAATQKEYDELVPLLDKHGVQLGVQNHCDKFVGSAIGLLHLIEKYDPKHVAAVWDAAHCALDGEPPELAVDILWSHLCMVNLKNAIWVRKTGPEAEAVAWRHYWTSG
ncbi:MAG: sugar phosphate isomerase/epimerase family protein, partial [Armatimonadota bacterium]